MFDNFVLFYDVIVVEKFIVVGVVIFGKLNMDEFVMGLLNQFSYYGVVKNFWSFDCVLGGFFGGFVVVVVVCLLLVVIGIDIGGLIC